MKKTILLFLIAQTICANVDAQTVSSGPFSGIQGARSSYFGYFAGSLATSSSTDNSFFGYQSGFMTQGTENTGFGAKTLYSNSSGSSNAATGYGALYTNTTGSFNTANGAVTLHLNTSGKNNTAIGTSALFGNTQGDNNTASGYFSLYNNKDGFENTANGTKTLFLNVTGHKNTAIGTEALYSNAGGWKNTAIGYQSLYNNDGIWNTATGFAALYSNGSGTQNTANGYEAAYYNSRGKLNTASGYGALYNNMIGDNNSAFGANAGPNSGVFSNTTTLGYYATATASNQVKIGNTSVISIGGHMMWTTFSDGRFKRNIKEDVSGLDFVNQLRPVSYEVDKLAVNRFLNIPDSVSQQLNAKAVPVRETGFIAQEVEAIIKKTGYVFSGVEAPQNDSDHYSIRYAAFVVPLVKAVQELTAKVEEQEKKSEEQHSEIIALKEKLGLYESGGGDVSSNMKASLFQNNPNPFSSETEIKMALPETTRQANLIIYNMEGKELKSIQVNERGNTGIKISRNDFGAGIYLYALIADGKVVDTKRLILTK